MNISGTSIIMYSISPTVSTRYLLLRVLSVSKNHMRAKATVITMAPATSPNVFWGE